MFDDKDHYGHPGRSFFDDILAAPFKIIAFISGGVLAFLILVLARVFSKIMVGIFNYLLLGVHDVCEKRKAGLDRRRKIPN